MRCYGLSKQERKNYEVVSGKPVIAPIKRTIYIGVMTSSRLLPVLSMKTARHSFRPGVFLSRARIFRLDTSLESQYAPIIQLKKLF
jgi:hypothetical protein